MEMSLFLWFCMVILACAIPILISCHQRSFKVLFLSLVSLIDYLLMQTLSYLNKSLNVRCFELKVSSELGTLHD